MCQFSLRRFLALFSIGLCFGQSSPAWAEAGTSSPGPSPAPKTFRFRLNADPGTLDWNLAHTSHETYLIMNLMEGLVEEGPDMTPVPALAEKWEISPDGRTYTFFIRKGVTWSDGRPLVAQHFVDSWIRLLSPRTKSPSGTFLYDLVNAERFHEGKLKDASRVGVHALDELRLQVVLNRQVPHFLHLPSFWVTFPIRKDLITKYGAQWAKPGNLVTLGPYSLESWEPGKVLRMRRSGSYFAADHLNPLAPTEVVAQIEVDEGKARDSFLKDETDVFLDPKTTDLVQLANKTEYRVLRFPYLATYYLGFDFSVNPTRDRDVRRAIALAIDRAKLPGALQGGQVLARGWIPPGMNGYDSKVQLEGSLYEARGALLKAGFREGVGFPVLQIWIEKFDGATELGTFLVRSFQQNLGIVAKFNVEPPSQFQEARVKNRLQVFVRHWGADYPDPENFMGVFYSKSGSNYVGWKNADYDSALEAARGASELNERLRAFKSAEKILLQDEIVIVPLFYRQNSAVVGRRVAEFKISPLNYLFFKSLQIR